MSRLASAGTLRNIQERTEGGGNPNVDRANAIVRNVRIIGGTSKNGREYTEQCLREAIPLYESCRVCVDHPRRGENNRSAHDLLGTFKNVHYKNGGLHGDLHLFESHPVAGIVMDAAERAPNTLGFSHNADGHEVNRGGRRVVESLDRVVSVDLVLNPATTNGIFESHGGQPSYPATQEAFLREVTSSARLPGRGSLREMDGLAEPAADPEQAAAEEEGLQDLLATGPNESNEEQLHETFLRAAIAILKSSDSVASKISRLQKLLDTEADATEQLLRAIDPERVAKLRAQRQLAADQEKLDAKQAAHQAERDREAGRATVESYVRDACHLVEAHGADAAAIMLERELHNLRESVASGIPRNIAGLARQPGPQFTKRLP